MTTGRDTLPEIGRRRDPQQLTVGMLAALIGLLSGALSAYWSIESRIRGIAQEEARKITPLVVSDICVSGVEHARAMGSIQSSMEILRGEINAVRVDTRWLAKRLER